MPHVLSGDARIYWRSDGDPSLPPLVLGNSIGTDFSVWDDVLPRLMRHFRVIRFDARGHGASDAPAGDYTLEQLGNDLDAVATAAGCDTFDYAGVSLGGMVGMWYGINKPQRLKHLVLCNTSAQMDPKAWQTRIDTVRANGMESIVDMAMGRFFTPEYVERNSIAYQRVRNTFLQTSPTGYTGCCAAIRDMQIADDLQRINVPTLVVTGERDISTPPAAGEFIAGKIPGAMVRMLPAAHIAANEVPLQFCDTLIEFLTEPPVTTEQDRYEYGMARRRQVLGASYVDARTASITPFTRRFQAFITRYAWGEVWTSSRFDDTTRRIAVLSMMLAMGRWEEFELHVGAALRAGIEPALIEETLVQAAIYCGVPAANTGFQLAAKIIEKHKQQG
ncbi:3-oxoadipate enol-lactonase [Pigmentiphaga sp.]|jgi:3-oxoadipate enol-lactonase|uniref:bifunctional 3-oxoadipate enol-lactonase/4-carboxymuconolactone decarboxylase PcaDC n=1 Tax=Pigmentiphaga sp. TaxID=1977564 RepID=UPI0025E3BDE7|nr:3-oxoadipate enol-lactonase [Pigmentiphaga sp.]MBX6317957.1 3-oxoadipate enol-lactonase [Pigmentiphaga sp.]